MSSLDVRMRARHDAGVHPERDVHRAPGRGGRLLEQVEFRRMIGAHRGHAVARRPLGLLGRPTIAGQRAVGGVETTLARQQQLAERAGIGVQPALTQHASQRR